MISISKRRYLIVVNCMVALIVALLSGTTRADAVPSEPYQWKNVTVGAGGFIPGIVFSRVEKDLAYLRSDMGGSYRWDATARRWIPLNDALANTTYMGAESIAPDPVDANTVYIAAGMYRGETAAILRSHDRGSHWDVFPVPFRMGGNDDGRGLGERLAVDPNDPKILLFGSRNDGLMRSDDRAETWRAVESFPIKGRGTPDERSHANAGLSFVLFDRSSKASSGGSKTIIVGSADRGTDHLFRSDDGGATWQAVSGGPSADLLPLKAEISDNGVVYISYGDGMGPNDIKNGAVYSLELKGNRWTDITPDRSADHAAGGYCGISIDRQHPGTLAVSTLDRWGPGDTVWRTTDDGHTWKDIERLSQRDVSASPFLLWGNRQARLGWWMAALAIDPFDSNRAVYATGATVFATGDFSNVSIGKPTHWSTWITGIEQTAITTLISPSVGPHLISGFGDIGGFVHFDLDQSPPQGMFENPRFTTTSCLNFAGQQANVIVRAGYPGDDDAAPMAVSDDSGRSWQPLKETTTGEPPRRRRRDSREIAVSADGKTILATSPEPMLTADRGNTWTAINGLPEGGEPVADRVDARFFYCLSPTTGQLFVSHDGGRQFEATDGLTRIVSSVDGQKSGSRAELKLAAVPEHRGEIWAFGKAGLFRSTDAGTSFARTAGELNVEMLSFGKAARDGGEMTMFAIGSLGDLRAIWRSDDGARSWKRLNDGDHEWGRRFRCISGDLRLFGRVYFGTDGRGVFYGDATR